MIRTVLSLPFHGSYFFLNPILPIKKLVSTNLPLFLKVVKK